MKKRINFHYEPNIKLENNSLAEAWLEIRWKLEEITPQFKHDPKFDIAVGLFYNNVKDQFGTLVHLDANKIPADMLPHIVRLQFRSGDKDSWPLLQLGPGVASVNFSKDYSWERFQETALFLREQLLNAYDSDLSTQTLILRYRNVVPFEYTSNDVKQFLDKNLNLSIQYPKTIPGNAGQRDTLNGLSLNLAFKLENEIGEALIRINTGVIDPEASAQEAIIFEFEISSSPDFSPKLNTIDDFSGWLENAHAVIHDWYFSLIDGDLRDQFEGKAE